jgi:hypothetical protein
LGIKERETRLGLKRILLRGYSVVDLRSRGARSLRAWQNSIVEALGGESQISPQLMTLVNLAAQSKVLLEEIDVYLLSLRSVVNRKTKRAVPILRDRLALAADLRATLQLIGLKKIPKLVSTIGPERMEKLLAVAGEQDAQSGARENSNDIDESESA